MLQPQKCGNSSPTATTTRDHNNESALITPSSSSSELNPHTNIFDSNNKIQGYYFSSFELYHRNHVKSDNNSLFSAFTTQNSQHHNQQVPVSIYLPFTLRSVPLEITSLGEIVESKPSNIESNSAREVFHQVEKFWRKFKGEFVHPYPIGFQAILRLRRRRRVKKSSGSDWITDTAIERIQFKVEIIRGDVGPQFVVTDISSSKGVGPRFVGSSCSHPFKEAFQLYQPDEVTYTNENGEITDYVYIGVDIDDLTGLSAFGFCDQYLQSILNNLAKQNNRYLPDQINYFDGKSKEFWKNALEREKQKLTIEIIELEKKKQALMKHSTKSNESGTIPTKPRRVVKKRRTKRPVKDVEDTPSFADGEDSLKEVASDSEPLQQISPNNVGSTSSLVSPIKKIKMDAMATEELPTPNRIEAVFPAKTTTNNAMDLQNDDIEIGPSSTNSHDDLELRLLKGSPLPPSHRPSPTKSSDVVCEQLQPTSNSERNIKSQESIAEDSDKEEQHHATPTRMSLVNMPNSPKLEKINISPAKRKTISLQLNDVEDIPTVLSTEKEVPKPSSLTPHNLQQAHSMEGSHSPEFAVPALPSSQQRKKNATSQHQHHVDASDVSTTSQPQNVISQHLLHHGGNTSSKPPHNDELITKTSSPIMQDSPQLDDIIEGDHEQGVTNTTNTIDVNNTNATSNTAVYGVEIPSHNIVQTTMTDDDHENSKPQKSTKIIEKIDSDDRETEIVQVQPSGQTDVTTSTPPIDHKNDNDTTLTNTNHNEQPIVNQNDTNNHMASKHVDDDDETPTDIMEMDAFGTSLKERAETKLSQKEEETLNDSHSSQQNANQEVVLTKTRVISQVGSSSPTRDIHTDTTTAATTEQTTASTINSTNVRTSYALMPTLEIQFSGETPSPSSSANSNGKGQFENDQHEMSVKPSTTTAEVVVAVPIATTSNMDDDETPKDLTPPAQVFEDVSMNFNHPAQITPNTEKIASQTKTDQITMAHHEEEVPATPTPAKPLLTRGVSSPTRSEILSDKATPSHEHTPAIEISSKTMIPATIVLDPLELGEDADDEEMDEFANDEDDKPPASTPPNNTSRILSYTTPRSERGEDGPASSQAAVEETQYPAIKIDDFDLVLSPSKKNNPFMQVPAHENEPSDDDEDEEEQSPTTPSPTTLGLNQQFSSPPLINTISPIVKTSMTSPVIFNKSNSSEEVVKTARPVFEPTMQIDFDVDSDDDFVMETGKKQSKPTSPVLTNNSNYISTPEMTPTLLTGVDQNHDEEEKIQKDQSRSSKTSSTVDSEQKKVTEISEEAQKQPSSSSSNATPPIVTLSQNSLPNHPILKINRQHPLKPYSKIKINSPVINMVFAPIGEPKLAICTKLDVSIRELTGTEWTQTELFDLLFEEQEQFYCVRFTPDAEMLIIARSCFEPSIIMTMSLLDDGNQEEKNQEGTETFHVRFFEIDGQHQKQTGIEKKPVLSLDDIRAPISTMEISGKTLVVTSTNGDVLKYSLGEGLRSRKGVITCASLNEREVVSKLEFVSSLSGFVIGTSTYHLGIWKLSDGSLVRKISLSPFSMIRTTVIHALTSGNNQGILLMCIYKNVSNNVDKNQQNCGLFFLNETTALLHTFERKDAPQKVLSQTESDIMTSMDVVKDTENTPFLVSGTSRGRLLLFNYRSTQCLGFIVDLDGEVVSACCFHDRFPLLAAGGTKHVVIYYQDKYTNEQQQ
ncbi:hypothetical protein FDP41_002539 [Naegleria fowleri]|uniref:Uncharacterized protein n=1 Tax=Naegleria fowleri TaxID=5763 RepID=A0A6A5C0M3_NAEFO|nr:uncharacterized protein FDP41_002539 [Naegleria fowleri]KAF0978719.1 hypothetical protein FDP41_002539 [Naegleria fowleri]